MDLLRSCYAVGMVFTVGGPVVPVAWFFTKPGAKVFAGWHSFFSLNWEEDKLPDKIGEDRTVKPVWRNGSGPPSLNGSCSKCYDPQLFDEPGMPPGFLFNYPIAADGTPLPCLRYQSSGKTTDGGLIFSWSSWGGLVFSGKAVVSGNIHTICCPGVTIPPMLHAQYPVDGTHFVMTFDPFNAWWTGSFIPVAGPPRLFAWLRCNGVLNRFECAVQPTGPPTLFFPQNCGFTCAPFFFCRTAMLVAQP